jgi:hypothetical protein
VVGGWTSGSLIMALNNHGFKVLLCAHVLLFYYVCRPLSLFGRCRRATAAYDAHSFMAALALTTARLDRLIWAHFNQRCVCVFKTL